MESRDDTGRRTGGGGAANTPPFEGQPPAVRSAGDHQIPDRTSGMSAGSGTSETERELERTRDLLAERAAPVMAEKTQEAVREAASEAMHDPEVREQVKRTASAAQHDAQRVAREKMGALGSRAETRINEGMQQAADRIDDVAERIDRLADERIGEAGGARGRAGEMAHSAADTLESVARYLRENDAHELRSDLERQVRARPVQTLMVGVAAGWVAGKILR